MAQSLETIRIETHIGEDGLLKLEVPVGVRNVDGEVVITFRTKPESSQQEWEDFVNATYGSLADDPIERGAQPPLDVRDEIA